MWPGKFRLVAFTRTAIELWMSKVTVLCLIQEGIVLKRAWNVGTIMYSVVCWNKQSRFLQKKNQLWPLIVEITLIFFFGLKKNLSKAAQSHKPDQDLKCIWIRMSFFCRWIRTEIGKELYPKSRQITMNFSEIIFSSVIFEYFWILARVWYTDTFWISYRFSNSFY